MPAFDVHDGHMTTTPRIGDTVTWTVPGITYSRRNGNRYCDGPRRGKVQTVRVPDETIIGTVVKIDGDTLTVKPDGAMVREVPALQVIVL